MPEFNCPICFGSAPATNSDGFPRKYCSGRCAGVAVGRHAEYRVRNPARVFACEGCGHTRATYHREQRFCSHSCSSARSKSVCGGRIDKNEAAIVSALERRGARVLVRTVRSVGAPDLIVLFRGQVELLEVKNPENSYGRSGLSPRQQAWAKAWNGKPPTIVRSVRNALQVFERTRVQTSAGGRR